MLVEMYLNKIVIRKTHSLLFNGSTSSLLVFVFHPSKQIMWKMRRELQIEINYKAIKQKKCIKA